ncbi:Hypothetical protein FKW44_002758, partial [Caligus rogercresseyi]
MELFARITYIFAAAAVTIPRFDNECKGPNAAHRAVQVAINDAARASLNVKDGITIHIGSGFRPPHPEEAHEVHDFSGVPTCEGDSYFCIPRNIS